MFWSRKANKEKVVWRNASGKIACLGDRCPQECDSRCPIWLNTSGLEQLMMGQTDRAIEFFNKAVILAPDFPDAHNNLGSAYGMSGQHKKAYEAFQKAVELKKNYPQALRGLIVSEKNLGMYDEALEHCEAFDLFPGCNSRELRDEIISLRDRKKAPEKGSNNWLLVAERLLSIGRNDGHILSSGFPQIPELMVYAEAVSFQILKETIENYRKNPKINPFNTTFTWAAFAGMGAVYHWNMNWEELSSIGIFQALTRERGFDEMDEYVLDSIGIPFKSVEGQDLSRYLYSFLSPKCSMLVTPETGKLDIDAVMLGAKAMYAFGMVFEMNRVGMN